VYALAGCESRSEAHTHDLQCDKLLSLKNLKNVYTGPPRPYDIACPEHKPSTPTHAAMKANVEFIVNGKPIEIVEEFE
jgi:hypothetical protein